MKRYLQYFNTYVRLWWQRLINNWLAKLLALLLALLLWSFVSNIQKTISQRNLTINISPLVPNSQVAKGIPDTVEIVVSGNSQRIARLRAEEISAVLDLLGDKGKFKKDVYVSVPSGISLLKVTPREVIGIVEPLAKTSLPVKVSFIPLEGPNPDILLSAEIIPKSVAALGQADLIEQVVAAIALTPAVKGKVKVPLYASDISGKALPQINLSPNEVTLVVQETPIIHSKEVAIEIDFISNPSLNILTSTLSQEKILLLGPSQQLKDIARAQTSIDLAGFTIGEHILDLKFTLPEHVKVLDTPSLRLLLVPRL